MVLSYANFWRDKEVVAGRKGGNDPGDKEPGTMKKGEERENVFSEHKRD